ncbi:dTDP-4-dehydrorhamnose 3,5-epimerase family protein [Paenibacillus cymbidii]|uniref:dTDP-4-dehydrorhamnose 3,5-epimerase family protein n=1 Tax=Paenibacillus cymbidii TaxID=1639034 RepID=UPI0010805271|nr:dTDP-4-dehydrorhamnose 3,5-epimerase family protein [Paenibacillus cymbidii]
MKFTKTPLAGAFVIEPAANVDERGSFVRTWCAETLAAHGLDTSIAMCAVSRNTRRGTLRGMHWQTPPFAEAKTIRCPRGCVHDVIVDLRPESPTYKIWFAVRLSEENGRMLYVPQGMAHGFLTLEDDTEVAYTMSSRYDPASARGFRWDDPAFGIGWPREPAPAIVSERDRQFPPWRKEEP